jgi:TrmH family RNA methyltransferase
MPENTAAELAALAAAAIPGPGELAYLADTLGLLSRDGAFSAAAAAAIREAGESLRRGEALRRALNTARHVLLAETGRSPADWDFIDAEGRLDPARRQAFPGMWIYLEDIRSPFNIGAMFRTAESFGAEKILLSPLCADPHHPRAERSAMGCVNVMPWERLKEAPGSDGFGGFEGFAGFGDLPVFALETGGIDIREFPFPRRGIMVVGSEELGVSPGALAAAEKSLGIVSVPTWGAKGSLNAAVAFGIAMQKWAECIV